MAWLFWTSCLNIFPCSFLTYWINSFLFLIFTLSGIRKARLKGIYWRQTTRRMSQTQTLISKISHICQEICDIKVRTEPKSIDKTHNYTNTIMDEGDKTNLSQIQILTSMITQVCQDICDIKLRQLSVTWSNKGTNDITNNILTNQNDHKNIWGLNRNRLGTLDKHEGHAEDETNYAYSIPNHHELGNQDNQSCHEGNPSLLSLSDSALKLKLRRAGLSGTSEMPPTPGCALVLPLLSLLLLATMIGVLLLASTQSSWSRIKR